MWWFRIRIDPHWFAFWFLWDCKDLELALWIPIRSGLELFGLFGSRTRMIVPDPALFLIPRGRMRPFWQQNQHIIYFFNLYFTVDQFVFDHVGTYFLRKSLKRPAALLLCALKICQLPVLVWPCFGQGSESGLNHSGFTTLTTGYIW